MATKKKAAASPNAKRTKSVHPSAEEFKDFYKNTLDAVYTLQDENDERPLLGAFQKLPSKKEYPDYYQIIPKPYSLSDIQKKVLKAKYSDSDASEFLLDFKLIHDNANIYNDPESWIVLDARKILDFVSDQVHQFAGDAKPPSSSSGSPDDLTVEKLPALASAILTELMNHLFPETGVISAPFVEDVDRDEYPDYFKIITHPTSFNNVLNEIKKNKMFSKDMSITDNLAAFYRATALIFENAQIYNDPSSLLHQDAQTLLEFFNDKFEVLKAQAEAQEPKATKLKLKLKAPAPAEPKVKINFKLKQENPGAPPKKRGRKKKVEVKPEDLEDEDDFNQDDSRIENEPEPAKPEPPSKPKEEFDAAVSEAANSIVRDSSAYGKTAVYPTGDTFIEELVITSSKSNLAQVTLKEQTQAKQPLSRPQITKSALFPGHGLSTVATYFDYKFKPSGYSIQSYAITLPPESPSLVTLKVSLHSLIHEIKRYALSNGHGNLDLSSDDEFQIKLNFNGDDVHSADVSEEKRGGNHSLALLYDLRLTYGLNVVTFEIKIAPNLNKKLKKGIPEPETTEPEGRHTRNQLQQLKMNWEVEKFSVYIVSTGPSSI